MKRKKYQYLKQWLFSKDRKPIVIRGARQVGKTWLVRQLAKETSKTLIEINFEKNPAHTLLFETNDMAQILRNLSIFYNKDVSKENSILFIDEIQAAPGVLSKLRWFYEDLPGLPVIAAGSLLEFALEVYQYSMPVGRISYLYLEPMSFEEFLLATDNIQLHDYINAFNFHDEIPDIFHDKLMKLFKEYLFIGGMPESVLSWSQNKSLNKVSQIQNDLLSTYRDDFSKYHGRIENQKLDGVLMSVPAKVGNKIKYNQLLQDGTQSKTIKKILDILEKAKVCHRVTATDENGVPLSSGEKDGNKAFKEIFIDVGLCCTALGLGLKHINAVEEIELVNKGAIAEQVTGQLLRTIAEPCVSPSLHYWFRDQKDSNAEIDYVIPSGNTIYPIEVKAGASGKMKSLHMFMGLKNLNTAIRVYSGPPSLDKIELKNSLNQKVYYDLYSIPFYLIEQLPRFLGTRF